MGARGRAHVDGGAAMAAGAARYRRDACGGHHIHGNGAWILAGGLISSGNLARC